jgi:two-component system, LuxR family, sensor kinase FixL
MASTSDAPTPISPLVLVVDDDEDTRLNLSDLLELDGHRVETAGSAKELFSRTHWDDVSLVLLDRKLPDGTPPEILPQLRERAPHAAVIIVTGYADIEGSIAALRSGAADYILKPINADALLASVRRVIKLQQDAREITRLGGIVAAGEEQYRSLFESTQDALIVLDNDQRIMSANPAACSIFHLTCENLLGQQLAFLVLKDNHDTRPARWDDFFKTGKDRGEYSARRMDGTFVDVEYRSVSNFSPGRHLISLRDVSDRKRAEERARQSSRLAAIGETMAALVHESRNALQRSKANLEMLSLEVEDRPEAQKLVKRVEKAQEDLHKLFEEVRQWAAPLNLRREECNLRQLWREVWTNVVHTQSVKKLRLDEKSPDAVTCSVDRFAMAQVFRNIFENAVEVSPVGEAVEIACYEQSNGKGTAVVISIADRGPGLSAEQQQRIFEPFFTTKAKGTGLGMAIASRIVQSHGGSIAASSPGGARIEITLPLNDQ